MARFTINGFARALGVSGSRDGMTRAGLLLKTLSEMGKAPVVGKIVGSHGRPPLVYDLDTKVAASFGISEADAQQLEYTVSDILEMTNRIRKSVGLKRMSRGAFVVRLRRLRLSYKGKNNPFKPASRKAKSKTRIFSPHSAFIISGELSTRESEMRMRTTV